jgi:hypothetical protein
MACPQTKQGTVVVIVGFEQGPVAVSADSLEYFRTGKTDNVCKISTLGNKLIVSGTNYAGNGRDFSVLGNAREVFASFQPEQVALKDFSSKFVTAWKDSLLDHINHELGIGAIDTASLEDGRLMNGIVVGMNDEGLITAWIIHVSVKTSGGSHVAFVPTIVMSNHLPLFLAAGHYAIADETYYGTTARGRGWSHKLWEGSDRLPASDKSTYWTRQLIDLTIKNVPFEQIGPRQIKTVGAPIDSVTIDHSGRIKWGRHQVNCR